MSDKPRTIQEITALREWRGEEPPKSLYDNVPSRAGRVLQVFLNADLRNGHDGLELIAKERGVDPKLLKPGQFIVFINSNKDKVKVFASYGVVAYLKQPHGKLDLSIISRIPEAFRASGRIEYDSTLKESLEERLARRRQPTVSELGQKP